MHIPRSDHGFSIPDNLFPTSPNATLDITCTPGPCDPFAVGASEVGSGPTAQCVTILTSPVRNFKQTITYCVEQISGPAGLGSPLPPSPSFFRTFIDTFASAFRTAFEFLLILLAWLLALAVILLGLFAVAVVVVMIFELVKGSKWYQNYTKQAETTSNTTESTSGDQRQGTGTEMANLPAGLALEGAEAAARDSHSVAVEEENLAEDVSQMSEDATQYDESEETEHLISKKETV